MEIIKLKLGSNNNDLFKWASVIDCGNFDSEEMPTTIKDISIILWKLCGNGVVNLLAKELSEALNISYSCVLLALENILKNYCEMSDEEAYEKTFG